MLPGNAALPPRVLHNRRPCITTRVKTWQDAPTPNLRWLWVIGALTTSAIIATCLIWQEPNPGNYAASTVLLIMLGILAFTAAGQALALTSRFRKSTLYIQEVEQNYESLWDIMFSALDLKDGTTGGHSSRVADLAVYLGQQLAMSDEEIQHLEWAAFLHDLGKLVVPDYILKKPGPLTMYEWEQMRNHPACGYWIVGRNGFLRQAAEIIYCHHERYDGKGYPRGLAGEEIPLGARIFAVADAYDAMTSDRPYRPPLSHGQAIEEIERNAGSQFDPRVVAATLEWAREAPSPEPQACLALPQPLPVTSKQ